MCGFAGFIGGNNFNGLVDYESILKCMANEIAHRGPDDAGYWSEVEDQIGLGHRRLSIVDLSSAGHQPMHSESCRYVIAFNGEIYNHLSLRQELESTGKIIKWRGHSDTETLLAGFDVWGIRKTVERSVGMFAFSVWDRQTKTLTLGRDRLGEKPLYYGWQGRTFLFGSELKSLKANPAFEGEIDRDALCLYMRFNYIPTPYSIYKGIRKLEPGSLLSVSLRKPEPEIISYWAGKQVAELGVSNVFSGSPTQAVDALELLLKDAIRQQMMADVPLGAFLSGGVDSSTVVALMQAQSKRPVKTFTIGFNEAGYNEAEHAKAVAAFLGTDHTELYVTPRDTLDVIPRLPILYDEPFSDSSQIPTFLVAQLARQHVTVSLSGDGGDELFCGYNRYQYSSNLWHKLSIMPRPIRTLLGGWMTRISPRSWTRFADIFASFVPGLSLPVNVGDKLHKGAGILSSRSVDALYTGLVSHWQDPASVVVRGRELPTLLTGNIPSFIGLDDVQRMMALDMLSYLPDDNLTKVDRAAMGVSLETRVPFLDHRVVEFAWSLPQSLKLRDGQTKWALRQVLYRHVPKGMIERPKMGFGVPIDSWLRGPLREWAESLLSEQRLRKEGYFHAAPIRQKWAEHLSGERNWQYHLWDVLMFQAWLENNHP